MERNIRLHRAPLALVLAGIAAACTEQPTGPGAPILPADPGLNPEILNVAWQFDVVGSHGKVYVTPPSGGALNGLSQSIIANYFGLRPGHPQLSILGGDVVELTPSALDFGVPRALPGVGSGFVRDVSWNVAVRNVITGVELIAPTFPAPPAGVTTPILIPYNQVVTVTTGSVNCEVGANPNTTDCFIEAPSEGNVFVSDAGGVNSAGAPFNNGYQGAPHSFFNDTPCEATGTYYGQGNQSDCRPYRALTSSIAGGATAAPVRVNYTLDQTVNQFRVQILLAADLIDGTPDVTPPTITGVTAPGGVNLFPGGATPDVRIGNSITLTSAATDDRTASGLIAFSYDPAPPGGAVAGNPFTFTCTSAGSVAIAITASDTAVPPNTSAATTVTVDCVANAAPVANAGPDQSGAVGTLVSLTGAATDDNFPPSAPTLAWDLSVPQDGVFETAGGTAAAPTAVSFTCPATAGPYTVTLRATDAPEAATGTDTAIINCTPPPNIFLIWTNSSGALITGPVATGQTVRLQLCTNVANTQAFQTDLINPGVAGGQVTHVASADLNSPVAGAGACAAPGGNDNVDQFTGGALGSPHNFQNFSIDAAPGTGVQGIASFEYTTGSAGTVTPSLITSGAGFTWSLFTGVAPAPIVSVQTLTVN